MAKVSIVPTGNSNVVRITLQDAVPPESADPLRAIEGIEHLEIEGATLLVTRDANLDWGTILDEIKRVLVC